jgi:hypothetical protein
MAAPGTGPWFKDIVQKIGKPLPKVFVETGLFRGDHMPSRVSLFDAIHTIELNNDFIDRAKARFPSYQNITYHHGDSGDVLPILARSIQEPALFYLDAHYSGGETAFGPEETPLLRELAALSERSQDDVIVIDDIRLFGKKGVCGDGSEMWPFMDFDWTDITFDSCLRAYQKAGSKMYQMGGVVVIAT